MNLPEKASPEAPAWTNGPRALVPSGAAAAPPVSQLLSAPLLLGPGGRRSPALPPAPCLGPRARRSSGSGRRGPAVSARCAGGSRVRLPGRAARPRPAPSPPPPRGPSFSPARPHPPAPAVSPNPPLRTPTPARPPGGLPGLTPTQGAPRKGLPGRRGSGRPLTLRPARSPPGPPGHPSARCPSHSQEPGPLSTALAHPALLRVSFLNFPESLRHSFQEEVWNPHVFGILTCPPPSEPHHPSHCRKLSLPFTSKTCLLPEEQAPPGPRRPKDRFFPSPYEVHESPFSLRLNSPISLFLALRPVCALPGTQRPPQPTRLPSHHLLLGRTPEQPLLFVSLHGPGSHPRKAQGLTQQNSSSSGSPLCPLWVPPSLLSIQPRRLTPDTPDLEELI